MAINAMSLINCYGISGGYALLSEETRRKLIALGIDPSTVTSEAQAKVLIENAEKTNKLKKAENSKQTENKTSCSQSDAELIKKAHELAKKIELTLPKEYTLDEILTAIANKIEKVLNSDADESTKTKYIGYNSELDNIKQGYSISVQNKNNIMMAMVYNADINKMILGLN